MLLQSRTLRYVVKQFWGEGTVLHASKPSDNIGEEDLTDASASDLSERIPLVSALHADTNTLRKEGDFLSVPEKSGMNRGVSVAIFL